MSTERAARGAVLATGDDAENQDAVSAGELSAPTFLGLMWLASPALPVGGFSYSEGLEAAVDDGRIADEHDVGRWLEDQLSIGLGRSELPAVAAAHHAWVEHDAERARSINDWVLQTRESAEFRLQAEQMGRSLTEWLRHGAGAAEDRRIEWISQFKPAPTWPVAFALAAATTGATAHQSLLAFAFGWAENMAQAAIKAVPLGQTGAQRVLQRLVASIPVAVTAALARSDDERQAFTPMLAILSSRHESQYSRLFRS